MAGMRLREILSLSPLIMACVVALLVATVQFGMFMHLPLWLLPLLYVFWITPNYFLEIVEYKALGRQGWPAFSQETLVAGRNQAGIVFCLLMLIAFGIYVLLRARDLDALAGFMLGVGVLAFPGAVALLAVTREFPVALNPLKILAAAAGMGLGYLLCLAALVGVLACAAFAAATGFPLWYPLPVYALFLLAWLTGSVVYLRRNTLGVSAPGSPEVRAERARAELVAVRQRILNHAYGFAAHGNRTGALRHIASYIEQDEDTLEARLWLLNEMMRWEHSAVPLEFGEQLIDYCEQRGLASDAARVRLQCAHRIEREEAGR